MYWAWEPTDRLYRLGRVNMARPSNLLYRFYEDRLAASLDRDLFPQHIAIILDGHRRYARSSNLASYTDAYRAGMRRFEDVVGWAEELDIPAITAWVLSRENLSRPAEELDPYFDVLVELFQRLPGLGKRYGFSIRFIGSLDMLPERVVVAAKAASDECKSGDRRLTIAMGYGGRQEITDACRDLVADMVESGVPTDQIADQITSEALAKHMYSADLPDPDLLIRTSGEARLSGFLLWQSAYAEFVFVDVFWPAFRRIDFLRALREFSRRERRFGK